MCAISYLLQHGTNIYLFQTAIYEGDKNRQNKYLLHQDTTDHEVRPFIKQIQN